jgi:uncharacterized protein
MLKLFSSFFLGLYLVASPAFATTTTTTTKYKVPELTGPVIDEAGILSSSQKQSIEELLYNFDRRDMAQIQVYITSSLQGLEIEQASIDITDKWKLGTKEKDNGILFLIAPNEHKVRIEVGRGLEGIMPDIYAKRINEDVVVPYFKSGQMPEGIYAGVKAIISVLDGEELQAKAHPRSRHEKGIPVSLWIFLIIWLIIMISGRGGGFWIGGGGFGGRGGFGGGGGWSGGGGGFSGGGSSSSW